MFITDWLFHLNLEEMQDGIDVLERLTEENFKARDYQAAFALAGACNVSRQQGRAVEVLQKLVGESRRPQWCPALAELLSSCEQAEEVVEELRACEHEYCDAPRFFQREHRSSAREVRRRLCELESSVSR